MKVAPLYDGFILHTKPKAKDLEMYRTENHFRLYYIGTYTIFFLLTITYIYIS